MSRFARLPRIAALCCMVAVAGVPLVTRADAVTAPSFGHAMLATNAAGDAYLRVDGKPFFFLGGAFFYERIPRARWRAAMLRMRAIGANTLDLYVPWNWHEIADGDVDFDGRTSPRRDLRELLRLGKELGFFFIVRPGPVIRNEWRNGGYPAWLLERPEYGMPLHDVLEGRYPATATLQNQHSDDAAAQWMSNATHMRYAARWLHRALEEFRPVADRVLAVQLDDDQGAYLDNDTYPAPHLHAYLNWLQAQVRDVVGPMTPTFINTFEMKVPSSSPVWAMGNWYQSDAYTIGEHDRAELAFATASLRTQQRVPLAYSEFQAGWLAGPEDPQPRPADPTNTSLALGELTAWGLKGLVDFPLQDTLAPFGWEAPFSNALYAWDAAFPLSSERSTDDAGGGAARLPPTASMFAALHFYGAALAEAHRLARVAVSYDGRSDAFAAAAAIKSDLAACRREGIGCDAIDPGAIDDARLSTFAALVVHGNANAAFAQRARRLHVAVLADVAAADGPRRRDVTILRGPHGTFAVVENWSAHALPVDPRTFGSAFRALSPFVLGPRDARIVAAHVALDWIDPAAAAGDTLSTSCAFGGGDGSAALPRLTPTIWARTAADSGPLPSCTFAAVVHRHATHASLVGNAAAFLDDHAERNDPPPAAWGTGSIVLAPAARFATTLALDDPAAAHARTLDVFEDGAQEIELDNGRARALIVPDGGARVVAFGAYRRARAPSGASIDVWDNTFDATGALRDDVSVALPPSTTDRIAKYTHGYPAGMFNRPYASCTFANAHGTGAYLAYDAPDVAPAGARFERTIALAAAADRMIVDERFTLHGLDEAQRLVSYSALASSWSTLDDGTGPRAANVALTLDVQRGVLAFTRDDASPGETQTLATIAWQPGAVTEATWTPSRSNGTLRLAFAHGGWHRVTFSQAAHLGGDARRAFVEAERAWVVTNAPPGSAGEVAKWYTQSPQKRPSESSCGFESHLPQ